MSRGAPAIEPSEVLDFWFGSPPLQVRQEWFKKSDAFDSSVRQRFGALIDMAVAGRLPVRWDRDAHARLAQLIVLDQFTRNAHRDTAGAFAGDARALALARTMLVERQDALLEPLQRWFVYMPFEHAEDLAAQQQSLALFTALGLPEPLDYARRHLDVVARFGRFPHRNRLLGRDNTAEETRFLAQPGSGF